MHPSNSKSSLTGTDRTPARPTICVTAIVKNEQDRIVRMLEASRGVCSCWCVLDTGSTDNTLQVLSEYNQQNQDSYPGHVFEGPFVDFSQARNLLLDHAQPLADWLLMADADYEWENLELLPGELTDDVDCLYLRGSGDLQYWSLKCVRTGIPWRYRNRVHEVITVLDGNRARYSGVCFKDDWDASRIPKAKYEWYASMQLKDVEEFPDNGYYPYRLADTYMKLKEYKKAITYYRKALELYEDTDESSYVVLTRLGQAEKELNRLSQTEDAWIKATRLRPHRREALHMLVTLLNEHEHYEQTIQLCREAATYPYVNDLEKEYGQPIDTQNVNKYAWLAARLEWARAEAMLGNITQCREIYAGLQTETIPGEYQTKYEQLAGFIHATKDL